MPTFHTPIHDLEDAGEYQLFCRLLNPEDTSTGGGSASAIAGSMAAALLAMVAHLTLKKADPGTGGICQRALSLAEKLKTDLLEGGQDDSRAFGAVQAAYRLPRSTAEEKSTRREAIQRAMLMATEIPLANAERCLQLLDLARELIPVSNPAAASDVACAEFLALAGFKGCIANVEINLPALHDEEGIQELRERAAKLALSGKRYEKDPSM